MSTAAVNTSASRVKLVTVTVAFALLGAATMTWFNSRGSMAATSVSPPSAHFSSTAPDCPECRQLAAQIGVVEQNLALIKSQLAVLRDQPAARTVGDATPTSASMTQEQVAELRAAEAETHRNFMTGVAQSFAAERVESAWANRASSRIDTQFIEDEALRGMSHNAQCRERTCRVEIEDDGSGRLPQSVPRLALGLVDVLPSFTAEQIDRGGGRVSLVLYMSTQPQGAMTAPK